MSTEARPGRESVRLPARTVALYAAGSLGTGGYATLPGLVLTYFPTDNLGVAALPAGLIVTVTKVWDVVIGPLIGAASDRQRARTGSRRGFMVLGAVTLPVFFALTFAVPPWMYGSVAVSGVAYAGLQCLPMPMLPDVISHDRRTSGPGRAGSFTDTWTAGETIGFALGASVVALTLAATGYVSTVAGSTTQPAEAVTGIVLSSSILSAVLMAASLLALRGYRLRRADIGHSPAA